MGQYQELIELQKQIVKIAEQNAVTQQRCVRLREQLDREVNALIAPRRSVHERWRDAATGMFSRLIKRPESTSVAKRS